MNVEIRPWLAQNYERGAKGKNKWMNLLDPEDVLVEKLNSKQENSRCFELYYAFVGSSLQYYPEQCRENYRLFELGCSFVGTSLQSYLFLSDVVVAWSGLLCSDH